ncbi:MAG: carboxypeptidase regulatory-like domain-containing protein [Acidobacteriota bacterium]
MMRIVHRIGWTLAVVVLGAIGAGRGVADAEQAATPASNMPGMRMPAADLGSVSGTITKAAGGGPAVGATVTATNTANGGQFSASVGVDGHYALPSMAAGTYDIAAQLGGYQVFRRPGVVVAANSVQQIDGALDAGDANTERLALLDRIALLEQRLTDLESTAVLSEPETRVKKLEVYVDANGNEHDQPVPGAKKEVTYQRERVYRRQSINEKIEEALSGADEEKVQLGVDATSVTQFAGRTKGDAFRPDKKAYALASADLFFTAKLAQYTTFFADVVALSGAPPDREIPALTLINGYTARLVNQNELNLREAWLRTELFGQRLGLTVGRLDLTNYFDHNAVSNDETTQFLSDALVNNQMLGLAANGTGVVADYDPKGALSFRFGVQQSNPEATSLSDSIYSLAEVGYTATPFNLPEGHYRLWFRANNGDVDSKKAVGISIDQKLTPVVTAFGRYGQQQLPVDQDRYFSLGLSFANGAVFSPLDTWGVGYAQTTLLSGDKERLTEWYYNLHLTERLRLSFSVQHVFDIPGDDSTFGYLLPGLRLQASF